MQTGLVLVVSLLFLFLNVRTALWVAAGIPTALRSDSIDVCGGYHNQYDFAFALLITLGIVDDAIVVGDTRITSTHGA